MPLSGVHLAVGRSSFGKKKHSKSYQLQEIGKKRVVEEVETEQESEKRLRVGDGMSVSVFKSPHLGEGGVFNPPIQN